MTDRSSPTHATPGDVLVQPFDVHDCIVPWPLHACTDATAAPYAPITEVDRRRQAYFELEAFLGRRAT